MQVVPKTELLAIHGGKPVRDRLLPYGRQSIDAEDIAAVVEVLRSDWITTGPKVAEFEEAFAARVGSRWAVSVSSGTAALHAAAFAAGLGPGDEAITTPLTFCATANCVAYTGAKPVFADIVPGTLLIDPAAVGSKTNLRTKAILPVDYAGQPADLDEIMALAERRGLVVIEDACHALGAGYRGRRVGSIAHLSVFSFHPVKHVTTGEGGMVTTDDEKLARRLRMFRNHGIDSDARQRQSAGQWFYAMEELGFNYRLPDAACALGLSQMKKLDANLARRRELARRYHEAFRQVPGVKTLQVSEDRKPAWHLYPVQIESGVIRAERGEVFRALRAENIGVNVHYVPVHLHPYYQRQFGHKPGEYPVSEAAYERLLSLPMFHGMSDADAGDVIAAVNKVFSHYAHA